MTITPIETIKSEAEAAAAEGKSPREACRFPYHDIEGIKWRKFYEAADGPYSHALAAYRAAIGADAE